MSGCRVVERAFDIAQREHSECIGARHSPPIGNAAGFAEGQDAAAVSSQDASSLCKTGSLVVQHALTKMLADGMQAFAMSLRTVSGSAARPSDATGGAPSRNAPPGLAGPTAVSALMQSPAARRLQSHGQRLVGDQKIAALD